MDADVIVVGAGLAGLRCAQALRAAGREVVVLEEGDAVGGRVRSDRVDGFTVDRGFQLLNPGYPAVRRWVDVAALDLQPYAAGVAARHERGLARLGDPRRAPGLLPSTLRSVAVRPGEVAALARWAAPLLRPRPGTPLSRVLARSHRPDTDRSAALDALGVDGLLRRVVDGFLAGVLLEDDGSTADRFALLLTWSFVRGTPSVPREGMQALPEQLARGTRVELDQRVDRVARGVVQASGGTWRADHVVVATGGRAAQALTGVEAPAGKGVTTLWWSAPSAPDTALLHVDARERPTGPLVNAAVVSAAAPSYAPPGARLVQASALLRPGAPTSEADMRRHAGDLLGVSTTGWELVARHDVPDALPAQGAPYSPTRSVTPAEAEGVVVCGDHRDTGSIQGALVSGQRAADAVLSGQARSGRA